MKVTHEQGDPRDLILLDENAQFMPHETFNRLVQNIKRDGVLQQWPFVWRDPDSGDRIVLSGNHRVKAAMTAGLDTIDWTECDEPLTRDQRLQIQLSHNAIVGESDPAILRRLYESIQDVDERLYSGLDDATLGLMAKVDTTVLSEANLDYTTVAMVFLPDEYDRAATCLEEAKALGADQTWLARYDQHHQVLDAIEDAREAAHVMNAATAFDVLLDIWDRHRDDLRDKWLTDTGDLRAHKPTDDVPATSLTGTTLPAAAGRTIAKALKKAQARGDLQHGWEALNQWAERYLEEKP